MDGIGVVDSIWEGYATDQIVRLNAASGGIITGSLIALLESSHIDGAVVNVADLTFPPRGKSILAKTREEIMQSAKSIYCQTEINRGLSIAKSDSTVKSIAVVGLPCQITRLKGIMKHHEWMQEKIVVTFGVMCGHNMYPSATIKALAVSGINIEDVAKVSYRGRGWYPFYYIVEMKDGSTKEFLWPGSPLQAIWNSLDYQSSDCQTCPDFTAEDADIACCDAWLEKHRGTQEGYSMVLTHTETGTAVIEHLIKIDALTLKSSSVEDLYSTNYMQIDRKLKIKKEQRK